ncbi:ATP-binding protein [Lysobacter koreensis]|uniref:histidine kinase n=1 Tax=Lysobacter koreensis TaxID=266122 RepID=A0ABW2YLU0_9GAMM
MERMRWWRLAAVVFVVVLGGIGRVDAAIPESPRLRLIGVEDGLPSSNVNGMALDRAGYLWVATTDGLARYDGVGMRVWRHLPGERGALPGNYIAALHVDPDDRVWVAIEGRGLSVLDADRAGFRHYRKAAHPAIGSDDTWAIASHAGALWFGTFGGGLHRLERDGRITRFMPKEGDSRSLPSDTVLSLSVDGAGRLWVGTTLGLARWSGRDFERVGLPGHNPAPTIFSITAEGRALWVGAGSGVHRLEADGRWSQPAWSAMFAWPNAVFAVVPDRGGHWLASHRNLWRVTPGAVPHPVPVGEHGPVRPMYQILRQPDGALWFPVSGAGLGYLRPDWRRIAQFARAPGALASDLYRGVANASAGGVWLAGHRGEIQRLAADGTVESLPPRVQARMENRRAVSVAEDRQGRVWVGERAALLRIDRHGAVREWRADAARDAPLAGPVDLMQVAPDGSVWLSCSGAGIQQRDPDSGRVLATILPGPEQGLGVGDIEAMKFAADGALWVAGEAGLSRWDAAARKLRPVAGIARGDRAFAFAFDGADALWLQRLSGLEHYRRHGASWRLVTRVGSAQGIPGVEGSGLHVDARHRVWLASLRGLFRWDPQRRMLRRFGLADGLTSQEFSDHAITLTDAGVLVAALADGGVVLLDTTADDPAPRQPALQWDRVEVRRDGQWQALDPAAPVLSPHDRELRVQLRLLAFDDPQASRYFTRLEGYDHGWVAQGDNGERVLAGLPAGHYTLRARATDGAGNAAREQLLRFRVEPSWWRTPWAWAGFLALLGLLLWWAADEYFGRLRQRHAWQRAEHEREVDRQASLAKTRFLATLGHEVRTPMTGVLGMSELLLATPLDPQQRGYGEAIRGAGEHLLRLVNDALDLSRIESGKLELADEPFDLRHLVEGVAALMGPLARERGLRFDLDIAPALPGGVRGDANRVRQILLNLLGNAIKFTEHGRVSLRVTMASADDKAGSTVAFEVADTGPGLNQEQKARLFRRFEQAEGARTAARYGGSGLGLAICQELAAAMAGRIGVDSTPGVGTCFRVALPLPAAELPGAVASAVPSSPRAIGQLSVLLVEDDAMVAQVVTGLLRAQGHRVTHAAHGLEALTSVATARFDVLLLDLDLPGMDGFALARYLRGQGYDAPLVALTARADAEAEPLSRAAGFDRFLRKPVTGRMLGELLEACAGSTA